ncbi:dirigent protein 1 [Selaginella moellendorffii]|nr:dirigent protein 1 [Selaginella moellendorffii]|eukprot:XP_002993354.2 dirigent protein 1 [Selaginella moellendorffii]
MRRIVFVINAAALKAPTTISMIRYVLCLLYSASRELSLMAKLAVLATLLPAVLSAAAALSSSLTSPESFQAPSRVKFYMQDRQLIANSTGVVVAAQGGNLTLYGFGTLIVMDDPLTETPCNDSRLVGRGQGMYLVESRSDFHLLVSYSAFLETSSYKGSLVFHGSYKALQSPRELPVIAGTGDFRGVQGYAIVTTAVDHGLYVVLQVDCYLTQRM